MICTVLTRKTWIIKKVDLGSLKKHVETLKPVDKRIQEEDVIISRIELEDPPTVHSKEENPLNFQNIFGDESDIKISVREDDDGDDVRITVKDDGDDDRSEIKSETEREEIPQYKFPTF